jgi:hypothetical protein
MRPNSDSDLGWGVQRYRLLKRLRKLEGLGLAQEAEPGKWTLSAGIDDTLKALGERGDIIKTMHRALAEQGLERGMEGYAIHRSYRQNQVAVGRVIAKGLGTDEMSDKVHLVVDGIDGRVHYAEMAVTQAEGVKIGAIVEVGRAIASPRQVDRTIAEFAARRHGEYEPVAHRFAVEKMDPTLSDAAAFVQTHVRRLEALKRAGIVTCSSEYGWQIPPDFLQRAQEFDSTRSQQLGVRVLSGIDLEPQVHAKGATWLDRQLVAREPAPIVDAGFGHEALNALTRRRQWLVDEGLALKDGDRVQYRGSLLATLSRNELAGRGQELAQSEGGRFRMAQDGDRIYGRYKRAVELVSGKYALIEAQGREFILVPWRPVIEPELGCNVAGIVHGDGISWELGRSRALGIGL